MKLETKQITDVKGEFFVPAYQRGYRWGKEVVQLLNDIMDIDEKKDDKYCLQPAKQMQYVVLQQLKIVNPDEFGKKQMAAYYVRYE